MLWRRMRLALAQRRNWTEADFVQSLTDRGCAAPVATIVLRIVEPHYNAGVVPQFQDSFGRFLAIDAEEIKGLVEQAFALLDLPMPTAADPEQVPMLATVGDLASYLNVRAAALSPIRSRNEHDPLVGS